MTAQRHFRLIIFLLFVSVTFLPEVRVEIVGGKLKVVVPGQPVYTLVPVGANRFSIEGAPTGFFIQFEMAEGKVMSLMLVQGSGPSLVLLPKQQ